jgi:DNA-binding transcriptional LysR family regulator
MTGQGVVETYTLLTVLKACRAGMGAIILQLDAAIEVLQDEGRRVVDAAGQAPVPADAAGMCSHEDTEIVPRMGDLGRRRCLNPTCNAMIPGGAAA